MPPRDVVEYPLSRTDPFMNSKLTYIENWGALARKANWSASRMAKLCGVSVRTLERHFCKQSGKAPKLWMTQNRHQLAIELLKGGATVKETARHLGYSNQQNFSREFKKHNGYPPTQQPSHCRI